MASEWFIYPNETLVNARLNELSIEPTDLNKANRQFR